ncbi:MAG: CAP domain-containing protein, partial [Candidatus Staskawiczbacteria bacterium]|nr:CAP domain-containing protein [Candidatus Staskawiczbacteria bacterium]
MSKILKSSILVLILIAIAFGAFYYYRDNILKLYENTSEELSNLNKTDFKDALNEIKKEVFTPSPLNIGGVSNNYFLTKEKIIAQTNFQRYNNGPLAPLIENQKLNQVALAKANDMFLNQYFEHVSPSGVGPGDLAK